MPQLMHHIYLDCHPNWLGSLIYHQVAAPREQRIMRLQTMQLAPCMDPMCSHMNNLQGNRQVLFVKNNIITTCMIKHGWFWTLCFGKIDTSCITVGAKCWCLVGSKCCWVHRTECTATGLHGVGSGFSSRDASIQHVLHNSFAVSDLHACFTNLLFCIWKFFLTMCISIFEFLWYVYLHCHSLS